MLILCAIPWYGVPFSVNRPSAEHVPFPDMKWDNMELDAAGCVDGVTSRWTVFRIETNSMLCLPPSPSSESQPPLWSQLILGANLPNHESEPGGKTGIVKTVTAQNAAFYHESLSMGKVLLLWTSQPLPKAPGSLGARTMCTTMAVLTTIALILRQRYSGKIWP